ncbi:hypothetical protein AY601_4059 [Pedobacter cryoconitis]|uniref:Uncharacterized protein n=1 Tax=Pedobacter cryoconitis TaxID=188932 RepID=A0A127VI01_9SPHI|nr:hypothetical protein [Pedobacter cryoconitis]AMQ00910.1 hypothetical protein AY601_4059 [Pedobacter cryoconitis]
MSFIFPDNATKISEPIGTEKAFVARATDGKLFYILVSDLRKGLVIPEQLTAYATSQSLSYYATTASLSAYQEKLSSGLNIKTFGGQSILGSGDLPITGGGSSETKETILSKLGATAVTGSNSGDQDLSNLVTRVANKSLILDSEITRLAGVTNQDISGKADTSTVNAALLYKADLGPDLKLLPEQLPSYVDDVIEVQSMAYMPTIGEKGKIYVTIDNNWQYRWSGSVYVRLVASPGTTDEVPEGNTNKYFTNTRVLLNVLTDFAANAGHSAINATDRILTAFQKLAGSIADIYTQLGTKAPINNPTFTGTVSGVTKTHVGLPDADNTSDPNKPISIAGQAALNLKANIAPATTTSTVLTFSVDAICGSISTPVTGNITRSATGAIIGVVVLVIHNSGTAPTLDANFKKLTGSGNYVTGVINYIYCHYLSSTTITYCINQAS